MAHQIPCVLSNIGALKETITPGKTGELVEPGSVDNLAETLTRLLSDPGALERMGQAGRERVLEWYTWDRVVDRFLKSSCNV
jgi:glycosyltransferase involved in cell wall biosynthesis